MQCTYYVVVADLSSLPLLHTSGHLFWTERVYRCTHLVYVCTRPSGHTAATASCSRAAEQALTVRDTGAGATTAEDRVTGTAYSSAATVSLYTSTVVCISVVGLETCEAVGSISSTGIYWFAAFGDS